MAYKPSAEDFDIADDNQETYKPSYEDFDDESSENPSMKLELVKDERSKEIPGFRGLFHDTINLLRDALHGGIGFVRRSPGNLKEIGSELIEHPLSAPPHMAQQVLAGLGEGAKGLANIPHEILDELANKKITPEWLRTGSIPEDTGVEKFLGLEPTKKSDELLRALPALAGGGAAVAKGASRIKKFLKEPDLRQALKDTQKKVNTIDKQYGKTLDKIESEVDSRGLNNIPVDKQLISQAKQLLDKTPETKALIKEAEGGNYKALRAVQADLRVMGENALSNKLSTERKIGKQAMSVRDRLNKGIEDYFESSGNKDLADDLGATRQGYKNMKDIYFSTPALAKAFGKSQRIPKNPATLLTEDSAEMTKFFKAHPEMKVIADKFLSHKDKMKKLKWALSVLGGGATAGGTYKALN